MKYSVVKCINGAFTVDSEWTDLSKAKVQFHGACRNLWNASDVLTATVCIFDENMDLVDGYREFIKHEPKVEAPKAETTKAETTKAETPTEE